MFASIHTYDRGLTMVNIAWVGFKFIQTPSIDTKVMEFKKLNSALITDIYK